MAAIVDNLRVAAEEVETLSQLDILPSWKCDEVEGFCGNVLSAQQIFYNSCVNTHNPSLHGTRSTLQDIQ